MTEFLVLIKRDAQNTQFVFEIQQRIFNSMVHYLKITVYIIKYQKT
jgi:hypothetical protein